MERNVPSILLIHLIVLGMATSGLSVSKVVHIIEAKGWWGAQSYCRTHHTDLVTIRNAQEVDMLAPYEGWIGLNHGWNEDWKWSSGDTFLPMDLAAPSSSPQCVINRPQGTWEIETCTNPHPFLCTDERLILVTEMKTWEGALQHCAELQIADPTLGHQYFLASLPKARGVVWDTETMDVTDEMWVGLRLLAGKWLWLSKEAVTHSDLPTCPAQNQFCGAMVHNSTQMKLLNCNERRNFICHIK